MHPWVVVLNISPPKNGVDQCPMGLLTQAEYGEGLTLHRCRLLAGHAGDHEEKVTYPLERKQYVHVRTQWTVSLHMLPVGEGCQPGGKPLVAG